MPYVYDRLPTPCKYGHYWLGEKREPPAILKMGHKENKGRYMIVTTHGVLFAEGRIRPFGNAEDALKTLCELERN